MNPNHDPTNGRFTSGMRVKLPDGGYGNLAGGGEVTKVYTFAGKGGRKPLRVADFLSQQYGGDSAGWKHLSGEAQIKVGEKVRKAEIHWFEHSSIGVIKLRVKRWRDEG